MRHLTTCSTLAAAFALAACQVPTGHKSPKVVEVVPAPSGYWDYASFDASRHRVLIARGDGVTELDVATSKTRHVASGQKVHQSLALPDGRLLLTNGGQNAVTLVDGESGALLATLPAGEDPDAALLDPASGEVFVMNKDSGEISIIDIAANKVVGSIKVGPGLEGAAVDGRGLLYVNVGEALEIAVIDTKARAVRARYKLATCQDPTGLAFVSSARLLVSACGNGHAKVLRADDGREVADIPIGPHPDAALYDAARDLVFIPSAGGLTKNGEITVLRVGAGGEVTVAQRIATQRGARTIAEDPATGRLYLPTATYKVGLDGKPQAVPGTFRILVVAP